jgi:hypothetical protein
MDEINQPRPLGAEGATAYRVIRVAFDMEDGGLGVLGAVAQRIHQNPATDRAIGAVIPCLTRAEQLVLPCFLRLHAGRDKPKGNSTGTCDARAGVHQKRSAPEARHREISCYSDRGNREYFKHACFTMSLIPIKTLCSMVLNF